MSDSENSTTELTQRRVRLLVTLRRLVREEFDITVHLHEEGAELRLLELACRSRLPDVRELAQEMAGLRGILEEGGAEPVACYRGAPLPRRKVLPSEVQADDRPRKTRIYRGRVVVG